MRVSRIQAEENRENVIDVASRLFRENGFDGIGLKDLMKGAGLTQGAFYKQFASKEDLASQASKRAFERAARQWTEAAENDPSDPLGAVLALYLSLAHREEKMDGCPIVALGADASRQSSDVKASFEAGIKGHLEIMERIIGKPGANGFSGKAMAALSTMIGAVVLSRAINDEQLSKQILQAAAESVRTASAADGAA